MSQRIRRGPVFKGFSTVNRMFPPFRLIDSALVKQDLLNEFNTRKGERLMRPNFGTIIFDLLFDPLDEQTTRAIREDALAIINREPRVKLDDIVVENTDQNIILRITITYTSDKNMSETLFVSYTKDIENGVIRQ